MTDYALPSLLDLLQPEERALLARLGRRCSYRDGEVIHQRGDGEAEIGIVTQGQVRLVHQLADGRQIVVATIKPGQHFGDNTTLLRAARSYHALAVGKTAIDHFSPDVFAKLLENPGIVRGLYIVAACRLDQALEVIDDLRSLSPEDRLLKLLAVLRKSAGGSNRLDCVQGDLAGLLGVSTVTLAKALKALKGQGLIGTGYRTITILDPRQFDAMLSEIQKA